MFVPIPKLYLLRTLVSLVMITVTPAFADDQSALAARIMALSVTRNVDRFPPSERAMINLTGPEAIAMIWTENRMIVEGCKLTVQTASFAAGLNYPAVKVTFDLMDTGIVFEPSFPLGTLPDNNILIRFGATGSPVSFINMALDLIDEEMIAQIRAQDFETADLDSFNFPVDFAYGTADPTANLLAAIAEYRAVYCTFTG
jgi:hypothetical protein